MELEGKLQDNTKKDVDILKIQREIKRKFPTVVKIFHYLLLKIIIEDLGMLFNYKVIIRYQFVIFNP